MAGLNMKGTPEGAVWQLDQLYKSILLTATVEYSNVRRVTS